MKKIIIYNVVNETNLEEINYYIKNFNHIRVNSYIWIINSEVSVEGVKNYLSTEIGISESILVFELSEKWAVANHIDVSDWLEESE
ncbi:hypothetical protein [Acinetobacter gerneri]|uniref:hypothetical protein n=1 Tax=Acinetobacter gerneri TaxID=202952 RepID=UPI0028A9E5E7|nr:hypothetical protein [Acinetobacter gerneri]